MKELKLSSSAILLQCSSPSFAELILHTWSVLDRYVRRDSDQLTHFRVTNGLGVLFSKTSSRAPGEKPLSTKEGDGSACQSTTPVLLLLGTSKKEARKLSSGFPKSKCANS